MNLLHCAVLVLVLSFAASVRPDARIIGGQNATAGRFPFAAAIYIETDIGRYFCGGSILNQLWIITSAHCVSNAIHFTIQLGSNFLTADDPDRLTLSTSEYYQHPNFNPAYIVNDLALIKLRLPITYTTYIQPISLPLLTLQNDTAATALGWGQVNDSVGVLSEHLRYVDVRILSNVECQNVYGSQIVDSMACVSGNLNEGTCIGDNGTPLVEYVSRNYWLVGVASFLSSNGCESEDPSGYTRIFGFLDWIRSYTNPTNNGTTTTAAY